MEKKLSTAHTHIYIIVIYIYTHLINLYIIIMILYGLTYKSYKQRYVWGAPWVSGFLYNHGQLWWVTGGVLANWGPPVLIFASASAFSQGKNLQENIEGN